MHAKILQNVWRKKHSQLLSDRIFKLTLIQHEDQVVNFVKHIRNIENAQNNVCFVLDRMVNNKELKTNCMRACNVRSKVNCQNVVTFLEKKHKMFKTFSFKLVNLFLI